MPMLVQKCGFIKPGKASGYMRYIATREKVEKPKAYMKYIATRPGAEHGLFSGADSISLNEAVKELEAHQGNVWTIIYSLRREDAERLGYDNADAWRTLLLGKQAELAKGLKIPPDKLRWYAAFHNADTHPHIHVMAWSEDPKQGYLTKEGIEELRSEMSTEVFRDELLQLYKEKDLSYREVSQAARDALTQLTREMKTGICDSPELLRQLEDLAMALEPVKGKKQYGYLKKQLKDKVDRIVDTLGELPRVAECYGEWNRCKAAQENYYRDREREPLPLSQQKEFRAIKNLVIREAEGLRRGEVTFEEENLAEPEPVSPEVWDAWSALQDNCISREERAEAVAELEAQAEEGSVEAAYLLGRGWQDGLCGPPWDEDAERWLRRAADAEDDLAEYALGTLLLGQGRNDEGLGFLLRSANRGNADAMYRLGKEAIMGKATPKDVPWAIPILTDAAERGHPNAQYLLGKLYLQGEDVPRDKERAAYWLEAAAAQGHRYAQVFLDRIDAEHRPSVVLAATRLMHHMGHIFRDTAPLPSGVRAIRMDRKRFRELVEQKGYQSALNHARETEEDVGQTMRTPW